MNLIVRHRRHGPRPTMASNRYTHLLSCGLALACFALSLPITAAGRDIGLAAGSSYDIGSGRLDEALSLLVHQSNVQLLYSPSLVRGKRSAGLKGRYPPAQALSRLLDDQGLTAVSVTPNTYLLQPAPVRPQRQLRNGSAADSRAMQATAHAALTELASVTVVGSRIPRNSFDISVPVNVITAEDIEKSGAGTLYELLREQPGMLGHNPVEIAYEGRIGSLQPIVAAASVSLYSLGPRGTLFLVDGRRVASFGFVTPNLGGLFDLNSIPLSFIDHIEILRGAASANYGADAAAGAVNIVLKRDVQGAEAVVRYGVSGRGDAQIRGASVSYGAQTRDDGNLFVSADLLARDALAGDARNWHTQDLTRFGLPDYRVPLGVLSRNFGTTFPLQQCRSAGNDPDSPYCSVDAPRYATLQPEIRVNSVYARWQQPLGDATSLEIAARGSRVEQALQTPPNIDYLFITDPGHPNVDIPDDLPDDYISSPVRYALYDLGLPRNRTTSETFDLAIGLRGSVGRWNLKLDLSRSAQRTNSTVSNLLRSSGGDSRTLSRYRVFGENDPALLELMSSTIHPGGRNTLDSFEANLDGALFRMAGGPVRLTAGVAIRTERLVDSPDPLQLEFLPSQLVVPATSHDISLHSTSTFAELRLPLHRKLQVDLAANHDRDNRFSGSLSTRIGLAWAPHERIRLRASVGRTRRAPSPQEWRNPYEGQLRPELMMPLATPLLTPCVELGQDRCLLGGGAGENPNLRPESSRSASVGITLAPTDAFDLRLERYQIERWDEFGLSNAMYHPFLHPEGLIRDANGVLYRISEHLANIGASKSSGWEASMNYRFRGQTWGTFDFYLGGHYLLRHATSTIYAPQRIDDAGYNNPKLSLLGSVKWRYGDWDTTLAMRHFGRSRSYGPLSDCRIEHSDAGKCANPSMTLFNLRLSYSGFDRWTLSLNVNNLMDRQPINYRAFSGNGYNIAMDDPYGRYYIFSTAYRF
ncbi:TonB-dependent receptor [Lysobacter gummosus]|uniref:TonB-dependent receptor n=1 Tax=Lysobacter gummosus TaxID=262324 RepID=A0ABY3XE19_9GAMM|nr:TonB-dependent receptor [Lysobacter gummosus]ALN93761.1 tonB dependent receptor family protein [Lysobacter gummosus]UNP29195.1 TonB-dependent receptor [Lysobacter gummosus]